MACSVLYDYPYSSESLCTVTPHQKCPSLTVQYAGGGSLIKRGNVSSVDSKPRLYLCETCHCVWAYYWCTVRRSVLGAGQRSLCALSGQSGHLRSEPAKIVMQVSLRQRDTGCLAAWRARIRKWFAVVKRGWKVKHSCRFDTETAFSTHLQDFRNPNIA